MCFLNENVIFMDIKWADKSYSDWSKRYRSSIATADHNSRANLFLHRESNKKSKRDSTPYMFEIKAVNWLSAQSNDDDDAAAFFGASEREEKDSRAHIYNGGYSRVQ